MAKFLNTSATSYYLEELIKATRQRLILISPYLRFSKRIKELLTDLDRMNVEMGLIYGKRRLRQQEEEWVGTLKNFRMGFCGNLHAKCYMNEDAAIVTSMNLYEFSQVNNNEMGVFIERDKDGDLFEAVRDEAERLMRIGGIGWPVKAAEQPTNVTKVKETADSPYEKLTTAKLAKAAGVSTSDLKQRLVDRGLLKMDGQTARLTDKGKAAGGEFRFSKKFGPMFLWPNDMTI